jgi:bla regulator protein blaR1
VNLDLLQAGVQVLGWCLLHLVWQAGVVGALYALLRACLPRGNARYAAGMLALVTLAACPVLTAWHELRAMARPIDLGNLVVTAVAAGRSGVRPALPPWQIGLQAALPWLVLAWACGVAFLTLRVCRQWRGLRMLVRSAEAAPAWRMRAQLFSLRLGLRRAVSVLTSVRIATPTVVGWLRPVIVMPLAILGQLPPEQIDLILAHELAHLRRLDHLANFFQVVLETLLFYHPVVHWISREVRNERELCCDALALRVTEGDRRDFVAALAGLEAFRDEHADLVLAANGGVLLERAWFIVDPVPAGARFRARLSGALVALLAVLLVCAAAWRQEALRQGLDQALGSHDASLLQQVAAITIRLPSMAIADFAPRRLQLAPARVESVVPGEDGVTLSAPQRAPLAAAALPHPSISDIVPAALTAPALPAVPRLRAAPEAPTATSLPLRPIRVVRPVYPESALANDVQGAVVIEFGLDARGSPRDLEVVGAEPTGIFDRAALRALSQWKFSPPASAGRRYRQMFTFALGDSAATDADVVAAREPCYVTTGTHICRHLDGVPSGVRVLQPAH